VERKSEFLAELAMVKQFSEDAIRHAERALALIDRERPDGERFIGVTKYRCHGCGWLSLSPDVCPRCCPEYYRATRRP